MISLVIPVYKNSENIPSLIDALSELNTKLAGDLELVFVVDGSPDDSFLQLSKCLPESGLRSQLILLSRNFGSFSAIRAGFEASRGDRFAVMAADLQESPDLIVEFNRILADEAVDITIGQRSSRADPFFSRIASGLFWGFYRRYIQPEIPPGGVDIFACQRNVRDQILKLKENNTSLIGLLFWVGFRRQFVSYERRPRKLGKSAWTVQKKLRYLMDSIFAFSDLPIRLLTRLGVAGLISSVLFSAVVLSVRLFGNIPVPGYAATVLLVTFFGALNCFGLGIIGNYVWRTFDNTKFRPNYIVASREVFNDSTSNSRKQQ